MENKQIINATSILYIALYLIVATISCICSIDFFEMTHTSTESVILAISFEIGSMGCLFGAITTLKNKSNYLIWFMFIFLTLMQMMSNAFYAYSNIENYSKWIELFDMEDLEIITQKRIIAVISGCILPIVSLSFIHLLVDLLKENNEQTTNIIENNSPELIEESNEIQGDTDVTEPEEDVTEPEEKEYEGIVVDNKKSEYLSAKEYMEAALNKLKEYENDKK